MFFMYDVYVYIYIYMICDYKRIKRMKINPLEVKRWFSKR
jgi:hypothetical protein